MLSESQFLNLVSKAVRAPTVHNVQACRFKLIENDKIQLYEDSRLHLTEADPEGYDSLVSIGTVLEYLSINASAIGMKEKNVNFNEDKESKGQLLKLCATLTLEKGEGKDPLFEYLEKRRCFRGQFPKCTKNQIEEAALQLSKISGLSYMIEQSKINRTAALVDEANVHFIGQPAYEAELYKWLRFSKRHPDWDRDGLNAECMSLNKIEAFFGKWALKPVVFQQLIRIGLKKILVGESTQTKSAHFILLFHCEKGLHPIEVGRLLLRKWLQLTGLGVALAPLSSLSDWDQSNLEMKTMANIDKDKKLFLVARAGLIEWSQCPKSPRLPVNEVIL